MSDTVTRAEFAQLAERMAIVERREARFDELRDLILSLRDDMRERIAGTEQRLSAAIAELTRQQITEDEWLARMAELRELINKPRRTGPPTKR